MKITLVIHAMALGGAERVMSIVANYWATHGWDVTLITLVDGSKPSAYDLDPQIKLQPLGIIGDSPNLLTLLGTGWQRIQVLRTAIVTSQPDVIIGFLNTVNVLTLMATWGLQIPVIVSEHSYPGFGDVNRVWQILMKVMYRRADLLTLLTENALPFYPVDRGYRSIVMPNPVLTPLIEEVSEKLYPTPTLIAVGSLRPVKGFDLLIQAFHQIGDKYPDWHLTILGEGSIRGELTALISQLELADRVHLPGKVENVNAYLRQADIFVMSSRFEGFPMALCEAMACGLPVIATDCLSGPREIIMDGVDGILVKMEDVQALAAGMDALMSDPVKRQKLAIAAPQILDRFGLELVMRMWAEAIDLVITRRAGGGK